MLITKVSYTVFKLTKTYYTGKNYKTNRQHLINWSSKKAPIQEPILMYLYKIKNKKTKKIIKYLLYVNNYSLKYAKLRHRKKKIKIRKKKKIFISFFRKTSKLFTGYLFVYFKNLLFFKYNYLVVNFFLTYSLFNYSLSFFFKKNFFKKVACIKLHTNLVINSLTFNYFYFFYSTRKKRRFYNKVNLIVYRKIKLLKYVMAKLQARITLSTFYKKLLKVWIRLVKKPKFIYTAKLFNKKSFKFKNIYKQLRIFMRRIFLKKKRWKGQLPIFIILKFFTKFSLQKKRKINKLFLSLLKKHYIKTTLEPYKLKLKHSSNKRLVYINNSLGEVRKTKFQKAYLSTINFLTNLYDKKFLLNNQWTTGLDLFLTKVEASKQKRTYFKRIFFFLSKRLSKKIYKKFFRKTKKFFAYRFFLNKYLKLFKDQQKKKKKKNLINFLSLKKFKKIKRKKIYFNFFKYFYIFNFISLSLKQNYFYYRYPLDKRIFPFEVLYIKFLSIFFYKNIKLTKSLLKRNIRKKKKIWSLFSKKKKKTTYFIRAYRRLLTIFRQARNVHWKYKHRGLIRQHTYKIFLRKTIKYQFNKITNRHALYGIFFIIQSCTKFLSWITILKLIKYEQLYLNGKPVQFNFKIERGDIVQFFVGRAQFKFNNILRRYQARLKRRLKRFAWRRYFIMKHPWLMSKKSYPKKIYKIFSRQQLTKHLFHYDIFTRSICVIKDFNVNHYSGLNSYAHSTLMKLNLWRYKA